MKYIFFIIFIILTSKYLYSKDLFNTQFYDVDFISNDIENEKIKKINQIKKISITKILNQTLQKDDYNKINKLLSDDLINTFVKNIIINDEKIINDNYFSKIKINSITSNYTFELFTFFITFPNFYFFRIKIIPLFRL